MAGGLERMTTTLATPDPAQQAAVYNAMESNVDMGQMMPGNQVYTDMDGDTFFDYDMSFGLSPVFRFDPSMFTVDASGQSMPTYPEADYGMRPQ